MVIPAATYAGQISAASKNAQVQAKPTPVTDSQAGGQKASGQNQQSTNRYRGKTIDISA